MTQVGLKGGFPNTMTLEAYFNKLAKITKQNRQFLVFMQVIPNNVISHQVLSWRHLCLFHSKRIQYLKAIPHSLSAHTFLQAFIILWKVSPKEY